MNWTKELCGLSPVLSTLLEANTGKLYILMVTAGIPSGENKMKLREVINQLDNFNSDYTVYAKQPWTPDSEAVVAMEPDNGGIPDEAKKINAEYFLEIFLVQEFIEGWLSNLDEPPSETDKCFRLIEYAENDA